MKLSLSEFIEKCSKRHNNFYDYSLIKEYRNKSQIFEIICPVHVVFRQEGGNHLYHGRGCKKCGFKSRKKLNNPIGEFIKIHGDKYDYSKVKYESIKIKVEIICKEHGLFLQTPFSHLRGSGCPDCGILKMSKSLVKSIDKFKEDCSIIHKNLYDYSKVEYNTLRDKIVIICKYHGEFLQVAFSHQQGNGCQKCNKSRGELEIENYLKLNNIEYEYNKHFESCRNKNTLPFDFYIPILNMCIEYDGIQHFESISYFGGDDKLSYQMKLDKIKNDWCLKNNIKLLRISYKNYNNIKNILNKEIYNK